MTPAPTYPTPPCINPDDVTNESVFQSPASFSMFLGLKKKTNENPQIYINSCYKRKTNQQKIIWVTFILPFC
jgi:hypothetical protein